MSCIYGCRVRGVHMFPINGDRRERWKQALDLPELPHMKTMRLCPAHFKQDDYVQESFHTEYCSHLWDGSAKYLLNSLDSIQRCAVRLVNDPEVSRNLETLQLRRDIGSLCVFYRLYHGIRVTNKVLKKTAIPCPVFLNTQKRRRAILKRKALIRKNVSSKRNESTDEDMEEIDVEYLSDSCEEVDVKNVLHKRRVVKPEPPVVRHSGVVGGIIRRPLRARYCMTCLSSSRNTKLLPAELETVLTLLLPRRDPRLWNAMRVCWECEAQLYKCLRFKTRATKAQMAILKLAGRNLPINSLSTLTTRLLPVINHLPKNVKNPKPVHQNRSNINYEQFELLVEESRFKSEPTVDTLDDPLECLTDNTVLDVEYEPKIPETGNIDTIQTSSTKKLVPASKKVDKSTGKHEHQRSLLLMSHNVAKQKDTMKTNPIQKPVLITKVNKYIKQPKEVVQVMSDVISKSVSGVKKLNPIKSIPKGIPLQSIKFLPPNMCVPKERGSSIKIYAKGLVDRSPVNQPVNRSRMRQPVKPVAQTTQANYGITLKPILENTALKKIVKKQNKPDTGNVDSTDHDAVENVDITVSIDELRSDRESPTNELERINEGKPVKRTAKVGFIPMPKKAPWHPLVKPVLVSIESMREYREQLTRVPQYADSNFKCESCIVGYYTQQQLQDHRTFNHMPREGHVECYLCLSYVPECEYEQHKREHRFMYMCAICYYHNADPLKVEVHSKLQHHADDVPMKPCQECGEMFQSPYKLRLHRMRVHDLQQKGTPCDQCGKMYSDYKSLYNHIRAIHTEQPLLQCDKCGKEFRRKYMLISHLLAHDGVVYRCTPCGKAFKWMRTYDKHVKYSKRHTARVQCIAEQDMVTAM